MGNVSQCFKGSLTDDRHQRTPALDLILSSLYSVSVHQGEVVFGFFFAPSVGTSGAQLEGKEEGQTHSLVPVYRGGAGTRCKISEPPQLD